VLLVGPLLLIKLAGHLDRLVDLVAAENPVAAVVEPVEVPLNFLRGLRRPDDWLVVLDELLSFLVGLPRPLRTVGRAAGDEVAPVLIPSDAEQVQLEKAKLVVPASDKERITIRLDEDIVEHFKQGRPGYQSRINDVLRAYVTSKRLEAGGSK